MPGTRQTLHVVKTEVVMLYPQGNLYPQGTFSPQGFNPQGSFYPQGTFGPQAFQSNPFQSNLSNIPFANTLYGYPQQTPTFAQSVPQLSNWQHPAQQQAALQQHAQLAAQQAVQSSITPYAGQFIPGAGQFIPGQLGGNFASGSTMH